ncbi:alpha-glucoside transport system substrate-binding protein [Nocardia transvalensis]|uniref:Alpha-glucoside transport system substrate-binding protein n=1 Tax=Nocardia transvalensis TaxID=37333 RepID=A0A7W9PHN1_9NOCA|nr:ABC transporter substrate-binding protein [Nocardia transvalensis]MBB5916299.1 alpha-glucoside transport system substrate-binding protein [Nocardia transvalensis]
MVRRRAVLQAGALAPFLAACAPGILLGDPDAVRIAVPWSGSELAAFRAVLDGAGLRDRVDVLPLGDDIDTALLARGRSAPDLVMLPEVGRVRELAGDRLRVLPESLWTDAGGPLYHDVWQELLWENGKPYAVPFKSANKSLVWYDRFAFGGTGPRDDPQEWTLAQWPGKMRRIAAAGRRPLALGAADGWVLADMFGNVLYSENQWDYRDLAASGDGRIRPRVWNLDSVRATFHRIGEVWGQAGAFPGGVTGALTRQYPDAVRQVFELRSAAMVVAPDFAEPIVRSSLDRAGRDDDAVGVMQFPVVEDGKDRPLIGGGDVLVVTAETRRAVDPVVGALAAPTAVRPWIDRYGGFLAPSPRARPDHRPMLDPVADQLNSWTVFDFADLIGPAGRRDGLWRVLTDFLVTVGDGRVDRVDAATEHAIAALDEFERRS